MRGQLPLSFRSKDGVSKKVSWDILYRYVPKELMERPKKGFSIPLHKWLKEPGLREWAESLLDADLIEKQSLLNAPAVRKLWDDYIQRDIWRVQIWYVLMFQDWMRHHEV